jgi:tetratricopeptide (TPR) repeat protein
MINIEELLQQAHSYFSAKQYDKALFLYSQVSSTQPKNIEYQIYCLLTDLGFENDKKAQELFDYFIVKKDENFNEAVTYVQDVITAYDGDNEKMMDVLKDISHISVESLNAIEYKDFQALVQSRGSFKEAYQDIMFSTKVAITTKDDLIDFIDKLIENNFSNTAYTYLDGFNEFFSYDEELTALYKKLERKNIENNH